MIQRVQSVYLLLVVILLIVAACMPVGTFTGTDGTPAHIFRPLGVSMADGNVQSTWGLFGILVLGAVVACCTIFLFHNRILQIRLTIFNSILLISYYVVFVVFLYVLKGRLGETDYCVGWPLCLPVVCLILNYLSIRAIYRDEALVRATDRLR